MRSNESASRRTYRKLDKPHSRHRQPSITRIAWRAERRRRGGVHKGLESPGIAIGV